MKYTLSLLYIVLAFFVSAQEKPKNNAAIKRFVYQSNSQISKRVYDSIYFDVTYTKGKKWVFHFSQQSEENPMVSDDEYQESYTFEIDPPKGNRFTIADGEFVKHQVVYSRSCFCPDAGPRQLYEGQIKGRRIRGNTWLVQFEGSIHPRPGKDFAPYTKTWKGYFKPNTIVY